MYRGHDGNRLDHAGWPFTVQGLFVPVVPTRPLRRHIARLEIRFDALPPAPCRIAMPTPTRQPQAAPRPPPGTSRSASSKAQSPPRSPRSPRTSRPPRRASPRGGKRIRPAEPDSTSGSPSFTRPPYACRMSSCPRPPRNSPAPPESAMSSRASYSTGVSISDHSMETSRTL